MNNQPISIRLESAKKAIINTINEQNINSSIMQYIIKEIYEIVLESAKEEYQNDLYVLNNTKADEQMNDNDKAE